MYIYCAHYILSSTCTLCVCMYNKYNVATACTPYYVWAVYVVLFVSPNGQCMSQQYIHIPLLSIIVTALCWQLAGKQSFYKQIASWEVAWVIIG